MSSHFSSQFFINNRQRLRELFLGKAPVVITANGLLQRGGDTTFPFAQDANFWYLTGIDEPDVILVMDQSKEYLIVPQRSAIRAAFDGAIPTDALSKRSGIKTILGSKQGWDQLSSRLKKVKHVATLAGPAPYIETHGFYSNPARVHLRTRLTDINPDIKLLDLSPHLMSMRMVKRSEEISAIQQAIDITISSIKQATKANKLKTYGYEYQLQAEVEANMRASGASGPAFPTIVAGGARACTLHNVANDGRLKKSELLIIDVGAEVEHYAADITRTISLSKPTKRQRAVYEAVREVQAYALGLLKPGIELKTYEQNVHHFMGEKLRELGLIKSINNARVRQFYPHGTSHFMGLNVHDVGDYRLPLEPGMVLTVEPGIYIKKEGIGIRIEDDVLITNKGAKVLSSKLPRDLTWR
jgi:Xaa-Pro aminopeptidase